jgi:hypothetical protein
VIDARPDAYVFDAFCSERAVDRADPQHGRPPKRTTSLKLTACHAVLFSFPHESLPWAGQAVFVAESKSVRFLAATHPNI